MKLISVTFLFAILISSCSSAPKCGSSKPQHDLPTLFDTVKIPITENAQICICENYEGGFFNVSISHSFDGSKNELFKKYEEAFLNNDFERATIENTENIITDPTATKGDIKAYFFKDRKMIRVEILNNIINKGLYTAILRDESEELIHSDVTIEYAQNYLETQFKALTLKVENMPLEIPPLINIDEQIENSIFIYHYSLMKKGVSTMSRLETIKLYEKFISAKIIGVHLIFKKNTTNTENDRDYIWEEYDDEGRKVYYFEGSTMNGIVYFIDLSTFEVVSKHDLSAENSYHTSTTSYDLLDNYYLKIDQLKESLKAIQ